MFVDIYSDSLVIPKFHFLLYYTEQMAALGPMVRSWTMRHEAKLNLLSKHPILVTLRI